MRTGTDINIDVCRTEGYPVVHHTSKNMDPKKSYRVTISNPTQWTDRGRPRPGGDHYLLDVEVSYEELWRKFLSGGEGIKSYCDFENCPYPEPNEDGIGFSEMASLVGTVHSYLGL